MSDAVAIELPLEPESARRAREQLAPFRKTLDETTYFDLRLLVSELIVDALNAGAEGRDGTVELRAASHDGRVRVELADGSEAFRLPPRQPEPGELGWGVYLVGRLSSRWGLRRGQERSVVWLEMKRRA